MIPFPFQAGQFGLASALAAVAALTATWDPAHLSSATSLTNSNLTLNPVGASGTYACSRSTRALQGLAYVSANCSTNSSGSMFSGFGIADATAGFNSTNMYTGFTSLSVGGGPTDGNVYNNNASIGVLTGIANPGDVQIAVDVPNRKVWIRRSGGSWLGGGDPAAGTSPTLTLGGSGALYVVGSCYRPSFNASRYIILHGDAASTTGTPPSGFTAANWAP